MGTVGDSYDNAMAESLWSSLKRELVDDTYFATKDEARLAIFEWINWYNSERLHSSLDYSHRGSSTSLAQPRSSVRSVSGPGGKPKGPRLAIPDEALWFRGHATVPLVSEAGRLWPPRSEGPLLTAMIVRDD